MWEPVRCDHAMRTDLLQFEPLGAQIYFIIIIIIIIIITNCNWVVIRWQ